MTRLAHSPIFLIVLITLATLPLLALPNVWQSWQPASCLPNNCFCEASVDAFIVQPINTYTNLIYVFIGLAILSHAPTHHARANLMYQQRAIPIVFGAATIAIGAGSFFYHASLTFVGQWFDLMGMYLLINLALLYNLARLRKLAGTHFAIAYVALNTTLGMALVIVPSIRREIFGALMLATIALEIWIQRTRRPRIETRWFVAALASFFAGYGIWLLDNARILCAPTSWIQGHAIWHLLTALSAGLLYRYYLSEQ